MSHGAMNRGLLARWFPGVVLRLMRKRILLEHAQRVYDAAKASNFHVRPTDTRSPDGVMEQAGDKIRKWARHLDENHDLSIGVLDVLVNNVVGTGVMIEPMVMTKGGKAADKVNKELRKLLKDWARQPEVTGELPFGEAQRLIARGWFRDGETLIQHVRGPRFEHRSALPYSIELIEPDLLPFQALSRRARNQDAVTHGVEKDGWGRPVAYHLLTGHPGNTAMPFQPVRVDDLVRVLAEDIVHLKFTRRFRQTRGVSVLHGVIRRMDDIKDYEESERIAARIAANMTGFIKKLDADGNDALAQSDDRSFEMQAGMVFDQLMPGEDIGMVKSDRPNENLGEFLKTQHRGLAAGTGTNYSSIAKDYGGTYSSQRQELVESQPAYGRLREYFIEVFMRRIWREFVSAAIVAGLLPLNRTVDLETVFDADMRAPGIPWIDPLKETQADVLAVEKRLASRTQVIRNRGGDPDVVYEQIKEERERDRENGLLDADPGAGGASSTAGADGAGPSGDGGDSGEDAAAA